MPKIKTRRTLLKRIRITRTGKVMKRKVGLKHLKIKASSGQKTRSKGLKVLGSAKIQGNFKKMLGKHGRSL